MPIDVERLMIIRSIASELSQRELDDVNLLLHAAELPEIRWGAWYDDQYEVTSADRARSIIQVIQDLPRAAVDEIAGVVRRLFDVSLEADGQVPARPLLLFASHLTAQSGLVGEVREYLSEWGIDLFVAHDSIDPEEEWHAEIERALRTCDAGVAFLFPNFRASSWCDQEIGWILGREVPCYPLTFLNETPYGPLGKKQGLIIRDGMTAAQIGEAIITWVSGRNALAGPFNASLVQALQTSGSFNRTDRVWSRLCSALDLDQVSVAGLLTAVRDNDQVYNASGGTPSGDTGPYRELVFKLAVKQPGFGANMALAEEVAKLRGLVSLLPEAGAIAS